MGGARHAQGPRAARAGEAEHASTARACRGWATRNNKGNPVKQYEPFFSATSDFEDEDAIVQTGVTPIIHYDPLDRVIRTELPDGSESRVEFDAWLQKSFDPNDAIAGTRWLSEHQAGTADQQRAAALALEHANTPTIAHLDALGRSFLVQADNGTDPNDPGLHDTRTAFDIEGNVLAIRDARGVQVVKQRYDVLQRRLRVDSPDAGARLAVQDPAGKPLRAWDSRGQTMRASYDALQRPTHQYVKKGTIETLLLRTVFGETLDVSAAQAANLRGKPFLSFDCAGLVTTDHFDFKSNLLSSSRRLAADYTSEPDWKAIETLDAPSEVLGAIGAFLEEESFSNSSRYDALNRVTSHTTPDGSVTRPVYNEANLLEQLRVNVRGGPERIVINDLDYNARGQRILCEYANPTSGTATVIATTTYTYDPTTFRLTELRTMRGGTKLQHLVYTYDPVGNITALRNQADNGPFFSGTPPLSGDGLYAYDALYRLIEATGREHPGTQPVAFDPLPGTLPHANDASALLAYTERYVYDEVGNIEQMKHLAGPSGSAGWTRNYEYATDSNRLLRTSVPGNELALTEEYFYDEHGSMTKMPHLAALDWDYADRLKHTQKTNGDLQETYFTYDASGQRVRKVFVTAGKIKERIYLGGYEIYRERANAAGSTVMLERQTLHVMDDQRRVALVETKTRDGGAGIAAPVSLWRFQVHNHLGSSMVEIDHEANVISYEEYHPYGSTAFQTTDGSAEVSAKRYRYTSKERDEETGLYYHGARYYAPWLGRWTVADPTGVADGPNPYSYTRDNPVRFIDPDGRQTTPSAEVSKAWSNAEHSGYDDTSVGQLVDATEEQRVQEGRSLLTKQSALEYATIRASAATSNWKQGNYGRAVVHGTAAVVESFGYAIFGDTPRETARNVVLITAFNAAYGRFAKWATGNRRPPPPPSNQSPPAGKAPATPEQLPPPEAAGNSPPPSSRETVPPSAPRSERSTPPDPIPAEKPGSGTRPSASNPPRLINESVAGERYFVRDSSNPRFYAEGVVNRRGELSVSIRTTLENGVRSKLLKGYEQFQKIVAFFGNQVQTIKGNWQFGSNLAKINELTSGGKLSLQEAAAQTWTAQQAGAAGFGRTTVIGAEGTPGKYTSVQVLFQR